MKNKEIVERNSRRKRIGVVVSNKMEKNHCCCNNF